MKRADLEAQLESDVAAQTRSYASLAFRTRIADYLPDYLTQVADANLACEER